MKIKITERMKTINNFFKDMGKFYYVGGCVRDLIMGNIPKDYDLITSILPDDIEKYIKSKGKRVWKQGKRFGTLAVKIDGELIEITTFRKECYNNGTRKPNVEYTIHLHEDLSRRDFTINSLVADEMGNTKDMFNGLKDIKDRIIRAVGIPKHRFKEDPLRILRGIRFASKYGFNIEENTQKKMESCRWELYKISKERIVDEINKIMLLDGMGCFDGLSKLFELNLFQQIIPSLHLQKGMEQFNPNHDFSLSTHSILTTFFVMNKYRDVIKGWSALLHDVGKPYALSLHKSGERYNYINHEIIGSILAEQICRDLKMSNKDREFIVNSVNTHIEKNSWLKPFDNMAKKNILNMRELEDE